MIELEYYNLHFSDYSLDHKFFKKIKFNNTLIYLYDI